MNKMVENYLQEKQRQEWHKERAYREKLLIAEGLYETVYLDENTPEDLYDENILWDYEKERYYKKVPVDVTDEEFAQIEKYAKNAVTREKGMFANFADKIKGLAEWTCWIGIISSIVGGIALIAEDSDMFFIGLLTMVIGSIASWAGSWVLYGFGELVEDVRQIKQNTKKE